jgi:hypothetical protein
VGRQEQKQGLVMDDLRHTARVLLQRNDLGLIDLWVLYWNHGGHCHPFDFDAFIHDVLPAAWFDMGALQEAVEELSLEAIA